MSLIKLCKEGDLEGVRAALERGVDVNSKDEQGLTGLMRAVENDHDSVVELLLQCPTLSFLDICYAGDLERVKAALQNGTDVNTKDENGRTGLMRAVDNNHYSVVELLLKTPNIDVNHRGDYNICALYSAIYCSNIGYNKALKLLLDVPNIDVNRVKDDGFNALHHAVLGNNIEALKLLLNVPSIDVNIVSTDSGASALLLAVDNRYGHRYGWDNRCGHRYGHKIEALKLLLNAPGINVNIVDNEGQSALHRAVSENNIEGLKLLLEVPSIDVNIVDNRGRNAVHQAVTDDNIWALKLLLNHPGTTILTLNLKDTYGLTPVMRAVKYEENSRCLKLLAADPRVDLDTTDANGWSLEDLAR